ncbi:MAG TPA: 30S ribosomal protein S9 [Candidatus Pacebacteria bacterium]|nr:30S ribosomal protein S9 [Candidatus Paceibacterota bacterium]HIP33587.1 30S ribosomal protein S9 [Bacteroidia bacterium]
MADKKFRNITKNKKKSVFKIVKEKIAKIVSGKKDYTEALGRRKTATARVRLYPASKMEFSVNGKTLEDFFGTEELRKKVTEAFDVTKEKYLVVSYVKGSGINAQAEATRLGIARALVKLDSEVRGELKEKGFLKRDPRSVERKKPGLKKARKAPT